ncbi:MAG: FAD-binding oxidoreductase [Halobacteriales archaeon]
MAPDCSFLSALELDGEVTFEAGRLETHATDYGAETQDYATAPDAVVWPASTDDVSAVLAAANERRVPVTPYAAGSGLEGSAVPVHGGVSLDLTRMNDLIEVRPEDHQVDVEPGVLGADVDEAAASAGLFFPPLPSSGDLSTVGGMIATDASGMQTVKYGEVADWVLGLEAVLADGTVIETGSRAVKTSSGYNLTDLVIGSEGTLAVVTRATLRLAGRPEQIRGGRALFPTLDDATAAVTDAVQSGLDVAAIELIDRESAMMANAYSGTDLPDRPMTFLEFHADHGVEAEIEFCRSLFDTHDVERFELADRDDMDELWQARKDLGFAIRAWDPDRTPVQPGDVTVPISRLGDLVREAKSLGEEHDLLVPCFGHAGDGNVHYTVLVDEDDPDAVERGEAIYRRVIERAIGMGGTATGEHGIGLGKRAYLVREHGEAAVETMRTLKRALDPRDTLNPGKLFPETLEGERVRASDAG